MLLQIKIDIDNETFKKLTLSSVELTKATGRRVKNTEMIKRLIENTKEGEIEKIFMRNFQ